MNMHVSTTGVLALGTSSLGSAGDDEASLRLALALLRSGEFVDTSRAYAGGRSEAMLGRALRCLDAEEREAAAARIVTKIDADPQTGALDRDRVLRSFEESAAALGVTRLPLLHLHDPYTVSFAEASGPGGAIEGMVELRDAGVVDAIGIAAGPVPLVARYIETGAFDAVLVHNRFTLVERSAAGLWRDARRRGMTTFNAAPFGGDLLARGPVTGASYAYRPASAELLRWTALAEERCERHGVNLTAAALRFSMRDPLVDVTVVGASSPARIDDIRRIREQLIPDELWNDLGALGPAPSPIDDSPYDHDVPRPRRPHDR